MTFFYLSSFFTYSSTFYREEQKWAIKKKVNPPLHEGSSRQRRKVLETAKKINVSSNLFSKPVAVLWWM